MSLAGRLSVVLLTHNRPREAARSLERLLSLPERPPVIVVDNGSDGGAPAFLARRFPEARVLAMGRNLGAAGRNAGAARARTPLVAFCDDDVFWSPGSLCRAAEIMDADPRLAVLSARVLVGPEKEEDPTCSAMASSPLGPVGGRPGHPGSVGLGRPGSTDLGSAGRTTRILGFLAGACVARREAFLGAGGYEPRFFIGGEESLLALDLAAAGWELAYSPEVVAHHHPSSLRDSLLRRRLLLRNSVWLSWLRRPASVALRHTARSWGAALREPELAPAALGALRGLPWALRRRRPVPGRVEAALRLLESS